MHQKRNINNIFCQGVGGELFNTEQNLTFNHFY